MLAFQSSESLLTQTFNLNIGLFLCIIDLVSAASASNFASIFNLPVTSSSNFTFALNIPNGSTDLNFHLSGPTDYSWIAVGTGDKMKDSLMFVVYSNAGQNNVTISPRLSSGEQEPVYSSSISLDILEGTGISNGTMTANFRCLNCTSWATGSLDLQSASQSWIYGLGPTGSMCAMLRSNSMTASIERHSEYGMFTMDMVRATGSGGLPTSYTASIGSALSDRGKTHDSNWPSIIHALSACVAFILLMPTGVAFLRIAPKSVRWHWINQTSSAVIGLIGIMIGFYLSTMFTKSQNYGSAHQILGIVILIAVLAQWIMGFSHHLMYKRYQSPTKLAPVHRYFGHVIVLLAIVNGGIGLTWSYASKSVIIGYSIVVLILGVISILLFGWSRWESRRNKKEYINPYELESFRGIGDIDGN
ncbi:uncharacterized protein N7482_007298 [Penicillium canariense]|uniref:DOMON domain-containing protein n=1 Tax=Penicillium canariense TaxID=189055 RepID=A0A9W9LJZ7_9EURO|nr:uncharacterized protein N7482_007298 [Penicillium canariense]KAJ5160294.1 hypothetical protein N7482_007298 [Penicillium canariense]